MIVYTTVLISFFSFNILFKKSKISGVLLYSVLAFFLLLFVYTFRADTVGYDAKVYIKYFENIDHMSVFHSYLEPGWIFLNKILYIIAPSKRMLFFGVGVIALFTVFKVFEKLSLDLNLSIVSFVMLGFYFNLMNQQRAAMAYCICLISFYFLYKEKYVRSVLVTLIAILFHKSALFFGGIILLARFVKTFNKKVVGAIVIGTVLAFLFFDQIYQMILPHYFSQYLSKELSYHNDAGSLRMFFAYGLLLLFSYYIDRIYLRRSVIGNDPAYMHLRKLLYLAVLIGLALQFISLRNRSISRFCYFFDIYYCLLVPNTLSLVNRHTMEKQYKLMYIGYLFLFMMIYLVFSGNGNGHDTVLPYLFDFTI